MQYVGIQTQKIRNNFRSLLLLCLFPLLVCVLVLLFCYLYVMFSAASNQVQGEVTLTQLAMGVFVQIAP